MMTDNRLNFSPLNLWIKSLWKIINLYHFLISERKKPNKSFSKISEITSEHLCAYKLTISIMLEIEIEKIWCIKYHRMLPASYLPACKKKRNLFEKKTRFTLKFFLSFECKCGNIIFYLNWLLFYNILFKWKLQQNYFKI